MIPYTNQFYYPFLWIDRGCKLIWQLLWQNRKNAAICRHIFWYYSIPVIVDDWWWSFLQICLSINFLIRICSIACLMFLSEVTSKFRINHININDNLSNPENTIGHSESDTVSFCNQPHRSSSELRNKCWGRSRSCLINSTNSKLVTVPLGPVSPQLAQYNIYTGLEKKN